MQQKTPSGAATGTEVDGKYVITGNATTKEMFLTFTADDAINGDEVKVGDTVYAEMELTYPSADDCPYNLHLSYNKNKSTNRAYVNVIAGKEDFNNCLYGVTDKNKINNRSAI